jgi:hypothetical protein
MMTRRRQYDQTNMSAMACHFGRMGDEPVALVWIAVNGANRRLGLASLNPFQLARGAMKNS